MCKYRWGKQGGFNYLPEMFELQEAVIVSMTTQK